MRISRSAPRRRASQPLAAHAAVSPQMSYQAAGNGGFDRLYLFLLAEVLCVVVGSLYLSFSIQLFPYNYVWFIVFAALSIIGFQLGLTGSLLTAMFAVFAYGSMILYKLYIAREMADITFNDVFWMLFYPVSAVCAGLFGKELQTVYRKYKKYEEEKELFVSVDRITGFSNYRTFIRDLEEEVSRSRRYQHSMTLLLVEIAYFRELRKEYGEEALSQYMRQLSVKIGIVLRDVDKKAYIDDGLFAGILPETPVSNVPIVIKRLEEQIVHLYLDLPKGATEIKVKLKFGYAGCPEDCTETMELYEKAKQGLIYYVG